MGPAISSLLEKAVVSMTIKAFENLYKNSFSSDIKEALLNNTDFQSVIEERILFGEFPEIEIKPIVLFLKSNDVQLIVHHIYVENLAYNSLEELKERFCLLFSLHFKVGRNESYIFASNLFGILVEGCSFTLNKAVSEGNISALDAKSQFRYNSLSSQLSYLIELNDRVIPDNSKLDIIEIEKQTENYLRNLIEKAKRDKLLNLYTEVSVLEVPTKIIFPVTLKTEEENKSKEFEISELVEITSKLIIVGDSGSGKTTTLKWLTYTFADKCLVDGENSIPLYVDLNRYVEGEFIDYVILNANREELSEEVIKKLLEKGNVILLIDGLDLLSVNAEFDPYIKISNFISKFNNSRYIISSRPSFFDRLDKYDFKISEIEELDQSKVESFIDRYVSSWEIAKVIKKEISKNENFFLYKNPLMLFLAINVAVSRYEEDTILPSTYTELYKYFIENLFAHYYEKGQKLHADKIQILNVAKHLFFGLQAQNKIRYVRAYAVEIAEIKSKVNGLYDVIGIEVLDDLCNLGLLEEDGDYFKFGIHQSFQEYFAAIRLKELYEEGVDISASFGHSKWENVLIFTSEMVNNSDLFVQQIIDENELLLASKCSSNTNDSQKEKLAILLYKCLSSSKFNQQKSDLIEGLKFLQNIGQRFLLKLLKCDDPVIVQYSAKALGDLNSKEAVEPLIDLLSDKSQVIIWEAAEALGKIGSEKAVEPLIELFSCDDEEFSWSICETLEKIDSEKKVTCLITALDSNNKQVKLNAAEALGKTYSEKAVEPLIKLLDDEDDLIRFMSIVSLGKIKSRKAIEPLFKLLMWENIGDNIASIGKSLWNILGEECVEFFENCLTIKDADFREAVVIALVEIDYDVICKFLIEALYDIDDSVCNAAMEVIELKDVKSLNVMTISEPLINILIDRKRDSSLRIRAAYLLGDIKSEESVSSLIDTLNDNDSSLRTSAVCALGSINSNKAIESLLGVLNDENIFVRLNAYKYSRKDIPLELIESLIDLLGSNDFSIQEKAVFELSTLNSERAVEGLLDSICDKKIKYDYQVASAFKMLNSEKINESLLQLLKSKTITINVHMVSSLNNLKFTQVEDYFIDVLLDKKVDDVVRRCMINSLKMGKSKKSIDVIFEVLNDEDFLIGWAAENALNELFSNENEEVLRKYIESESCAVSNVAFEIYCNIEKNKRSINQLFVDFI